MSAQTAFIIVAVLTVIVALAVRGGPRVTQITRTREKKDRDDA